MKENMLIKYVQEATFYLNDEEVLFIMRNTVLIAFLKLPGVLTLFVLEKLSFFLPCCPSEIKIMPASLFLL